MTNEDIKKLWVQLLEYDESLDKPDEPGVVVHPPDVNSWKLMGILEELDRLRKKLGLKPLKPEKATV